jgi:hypothetical protein
MHARQTFHRHVWPCVQPSWGESLWELQDVRSLVNPVLLHYLRYSALTALSTTTMLLSPLVQRLSLLSDVHSRWTRRRSISRDSDVGVSLSVSYLPSPRTLFLLHMPLSPLPILADQSPFPHHLGGRRARWAVCLLLLPSPLRLTVSTHTNTEASMILLTSLTSAQFSRYSPNLASSPLSPCTKTSGRAMPAGPARRHGRLSSQALT